MVIADELLLRVKAETAAAQRELATFSSKVQDSMKSAGTSMSKMGKTLTTRVTLPLLGAGVALINLASDLDESTSKFNTVFGDFAADAEAAFGKSMPEAIGLSTAAARDLTATMGNVMLGLGFTKQEAAKLSPELMTLAADLASFNNVPVEQAARAIISGLTGEREALKSLGIVLNEADVKQRAFEMGLWDGKDAIDAQAKALATQSLMFEKAGPAVGDFARTSEGLANQTRILKSQLADAGAQLGTILLPYALEAAGIFKELLDRFMQLSPAVQEIIVKIGALTAGIGPVLMVGGKLLTIFASINPVVLAIAAAIGAVVFIMGKLGISWQDVADFALGIWEGTLKPLFEDLEAFITEVIGAVTKWIEDNWDTIMETVQAGIQFVIDLWNELWSVLEPLVAKLTEFIEDEVGALVDWFVEVWPMIQEVVEKVLKIVKQLWERIWGSIKKYIGPIFDGILRTISGVLDIIKGVIKTVLSVITGDWEGAWEGIKQFVSGIWDSINGIIDTAWQALQLLWETGISVLAAAWEGLWLLVGNAVEAAWGGIVGAVKGIINALLGVLEGGINMALRALQKAVDAADVLAGPFINFPDAMFSPVSIPRLAEGGMTTKHGPVRVGERGPETVFLPGGATVAPAGNMGGVSVVIERLEGGDPKALAHEIGWEYRKRGSA